ncbi:hypothetical protein N9X70_03445 [Gammaproteobacteria bacterium]|nr:hypothetical protein [Gammaproteobacteria bacterium]|tara:strand:+ start:4626 stop:4799 length:174 start_codon:yes stop_codon:yes gene_type:complete
MDAILLVLIGAISGAAIVTLLNISRKGREGSKGITEEYTSKKGVKRTAKKDREDFIV